MCCRLKRKTSFGYSQYIDGMKDSVPLLYNYFVSLWGLICFHHVTWSHDNLSHVESILYQPQPLFFLVGFLGLKFSQYYIRSYISSDITSTNQGLCSCFWLAIAITTNNIFRVRTICICNSKTQTCP
jgi:hypothetical protein